LAPSCSGCWSRAAGCEGGVERRRVSMIEVTTALFHTLADGSVDDTRFTLANVPLAQFTWWIVLCFLALHAVVAAILTELMGRSYGKPLLWFAISFCLPLVGPVSIWLYHLIVSTSVTDARRRTFWERLLSTAPANLLKAFWREQARQEEVKLRPVSQYRDVACRPNGADPEIDALLRNQKYAEARGRAWRMLDIAHELRDVPKSRIYQDYLEIIAEQEAVNSGR
jgi:hypothetical protein